MIQIESGNDEDRSMIKQDQNIKMVNSSLNQCYCCNSQVVSKYRSVNAKIVCQDCLSKISKLKVQYNLQSSYKTFMTPSSQFLCKLTMTATSQFDFQLRVCDICTQEKMLIKICANDHYYCEQCIKNYIEQNYQTSTQCIDGQCKEIMNLQVVFQYLDSEQLMRWKPFTQQIHCISTFCPADWTVWPTYISGDVEIISQNQCQCKRCHKKFCFKCRTIHKGGNCTNKDPLFNNYLERNQCFRCLVCNSLCEPSFCQNNYLVDNFKEWNYNIYECFVCKRKFCYDCKEKSKINLFSVHKCENCIFTFRKWKKQKKKVPLARQILQGVFILCILILFSIYSMIFIQIPQIFDIFFKMMEPVCQTQNPFKITLLFVNMPFIVAIMIVIYAITLVPLAIYNSHQIFIKRRGNTDIEI